MNGVYAWCDEEHSSSILSRTPSDITLSGPPSKCSLTRDGGAVFISINDPRYSDECLRDHEDGDDELEQVVRTALRRPVMLRLLTNNYDLGRDAINALLDDERVLIECLPDGVLRGDLYAKALRDNPQWRWWRDAPPNGITKRDGAESELLSGAALTERTPLARLASRRP